MRHLCFNVSCGFQCSRMNKSVDYLVEASAAEARAITAALAAAKAREISKEIMLPDRDRGAEATSSGNQPGSAGVRLHHRAVKYY